MILKFRTMTVEENGSDVVQATRADLRVTAIGRLLRASSIDELPQFWNVLKGEMSLIGPRPHALAHENYFELALRDYAFRRHVKPGITGWAQCNGARGATPTIEHVAERVKLDLWYINNWSFWLDLLILAKTFWRFCGSTERLLTRFPHRPWTAEATSGSNFRFPPARFFWGAPPAQASCWMKVGSTTRRCAAPTFVSRPNFCLNASSVIAAKEPLDVV